jgi:uncharacterized protein YbjQ (UPF0145 family)
LISSTAANADENITGVSGQKGNGTITVLGISQMKITTMETVAGRSNEETLGVVRGSALWSKRIMKYNHGGLRGLQYTTMEDMDDGLNAAKEKAEAKAKAQAKELGADSIIGLRLEVFEMSDGLFTAVATGTAVRTAILPAAMPVFNAAAANDDDIDVMPYIVKQTPRMLSSLMH